MRQLVSVIVPVYNCEKYVEKCISSIMNQTYQDLQIIVIDDGSKDNSEVIMKDLCLRDQRIFYLRQENHGVSYSRNCGIRHAKGEFITFVDGDDYIDQGYIENLLRALAASGGDFALCGYKQVDENGRIIFDCIPYSYEPLQHEECVYKISAVCGRMYRLDFLQREGLLFDETPGVRGEDIPFSYWANARARNIVSLSKSMYYYVQHSTSAMHNFKGLRDYNLPLDQLNRLFFEMQDKKMNSKEFFEMGVFRVFAQFLFSLSIGAEKRKVKRNCKFVYESVNLYFQDYMSNRKLTLFNKLQIPFLEKACVFIFKFLVYLHVLYPMVIILSDAAFIKEKVCHWFQLLYQRIMPKRK